MANGIGRYIYGVADNGRKIHLGKIGVDNQAVYTITHKDIAAIVHNCRAIAYQSSNQETATSWVTAHAAVVDTAWKKLGTVLPSKFNTIIKGDNRQVKNWLTSEYINLKQKIEAVKGRAEFGIQVLWDPEKIITELKNQDPVFKEIAIKSKESSSGVAYLQQQKLEMLSREALEQKADNYFKQIINSLKKYASDYQVEENKKNQDKPMLVNLSCLVEPGKVANLSQELEEVGKSNKLTVRLVGPWPPYSFV